MAEDINILCQKHVLTSLGSNDYVVASAGSWASIFKLNSDANIKRTLRPWVLVMLPHIGIHSYAFIYHTYRSFLYNSH